jgi:cysteine desulfurase
LRASALEEIASNLQISPQSLQPIGEPHIGHYLAIAGLLEPQSYLLTSTIDVGKARAVARAHTGERGELSVDGTGAIGPITAHPSKSTVLHFQVANGETGYEQDVQSLTQLPASISIALDATRALPRSYADTRADTALFDSLSWGGPQGLSLLAIFSPEKFRYPLPHIAPITTPGSYSLPLLIGSAIAISESVTRSEISTLRARAIETLSRIDGLSIVLPEANSESAYISILVEKYSAEEVSRHLRVRGIEVDAGSACSPEDLAPSHVIAALNLPTSGHIRITLRREQTADELTALNRALTEVLQELSN